MKHLTIPTLGALILAVASAAAEPARKPANSRQVDLDAAARATAALYANLPKAAPAPVPAPAPVAAPTAASTAAPTAALAAPVLPLLPASPLPPVTLPARVSPLLPAGAEPAPVAAVQAPAGEVWAGAYQCDHAEKVSLRPGAVADQVELQWKAQRWQMRRTDARSGAMRLEDASARMVWIQLPNKSMLLDQRLGRRLLDECQHDVQLETAAQMKANPPPALFDTKGMGR